MSGYLGILLAILCPWYGCSLASHKPGRLVPPERVFASIVDEDLALFLSTWSFGDGTRGSGRLTPSHRYTDDGTYKAILTVTDGAGNVASASTVVTVNAVALTAAITGLPSSGHSPEGTTLSLGSTVIDPSTVDTAAGLTYAWSVTKSGNAFASGNSSTFSFTPDTAATDVATLTATDKDTGTATTTNTGGVSSGGKKGATYYVATTGSDTNPGTLASPFRTLNHAVTVLHPGDTLDIRGGTYGEGLIDVLPGGTSWANPVTIMAHQGETVTLQPPSGNNVLHFAKPTEQYIVINGLILDGALIKHNGVKITYQTGSGPANHIRIQSTEIENAPQQGILVTGGSGHESDFNEFLKLKIHNNGTSYLHHGIYLESNSNLVDGCDIYSNAGEGVQIYMSGGVNGQDAGNNIVRNSMFHNNSTATAWDAGVGVYTGDNNLVYNNLFWGNPTGIAVDYGASNSKLYNNTVYGSTGDGGITVAMNANANNTYIQNNIIYQNSQGIVDHGTSTVANHNTANTTDPLFVNAAAHDFHLQAGSPAVDAGVTLAAVTTDFSGAARPKGKGYDIGAYECY
jgi:hypothetical protein